MILKCIMFILFWMIGCAIADYVIEFESRAYTMSFGVAVYFAAKYFSKLDAILLLAYCATLAVVSTALYTLVIYTAIDKEWF